MSILYLTDDEKIILPFDLLILRFVLDT